MKETGGAKSNRDLLTSLYKRRAVTALCCCVLTLALSSYAMTAGVIYTVEVLEKNGFTAFTYFTMISNALAALSAAFVIPYAVEGIRKKRFALPEWLAAFHYAGASSIAVVAAFVLAFISWTSPQDAFGGHNFFTHVVCPVLILIAFFQAENGQTYSARDRIAACIPFAAYASVYFVEVGLIGEKNGGWPDLYRVTEFLPPLAGWFLFLLFGTVVALIVGAISDRLTEFRKKKMFRGWKENADPVEVKIEAYGLGTMMSRAGDKNGVLVPLDILEPLARKAGLETDELIGPYLTGYRKGLTDGENKPGK